MSMYLLMLPMPFDIDGYNVYDCCLQNQNCFLVYKVFAVLAIDHANASFCEMSTKPRILEIVRKMRSI